MASYISENEDRSTIQYIMERAQAVGKQDIEPCETKVSVLSLLTIPAAIQGDSTWANDKKDAKPNGAAVQVGMHSEEGPCRVLGAVFAKSGREEVHRGLVPQAPI